jgi:hypothetical protein
MTPYEVDAILDLEELFANSFLYDVKSNQVAFIEALSNIGINQKLLKSIESNS